MLAEDVEDDHYADFLEALRFLAGSGGAEQISDEFSRYRDELLRIGKHGTHGARTRRSDVERALRRVMVRTERLSVTPDRNGMLVERKSDRVTLESGDLQSFVALDAIARRLDSGDVLEYWKSAPYSLGFMEHYKLIRELERAEQHGVSRSELHQLASRGARLIPWEQIERYGPLNPGNARL